MYLVITPVFRNLVEVFQKPNRQAVSVPKHGGGWGGFCLSESRKLKRCAALGQGCPKAGGQFDDANMRNWSAGCCTYWRLHPRQFLPSELVVLRAQRHGRGRHRDLGANPFNRLPLTPISAAISRMFSPKCEWRGILATTGQNREGHTRIEKTITTTRQHYYCSREQSTARGYQKHTYSDDFDVSS
jgi:hypothetical protein